MAVPKNLRLAKNRILTVLRTGRSIKGSFGYLRWKKHNNGKSISVVVGKKVSKKAVTRNLIRRRLTNALVASLAKIDFSAEIVFVSTRDISHKISYSQILDEIEKMISGINLRK